MNIIDIKREIRAIKKMGGYWKRGDLIYKWRKSAEDYAKTIRNYGCGKARVVKLHLHRYRVDEWKEVC